MRFVLLTLILLLVLPSLVSAATYYVDGTVASSGSGTSWGQATRTIAEGVSLLNSGDTLKIASGTYNEPIVIDGETFGSETKIETDDKTGNPGIVTLTGRTNAGGHYSVVYFHNVGDITLDGRQSVMEGDSNNGFVLNPSSSAAGVLVNEYGAVGTVRILRTEVAGNKPSGDIATIDVLYARDVEIAYNKLHQTGGNDGDVIALNGDYSPGPAPLSGSIHHNDVAGNPANGYGAITQKRTNGVDVYNNYIHNVGGGGVGIILRDFQFVGSDSGDVYNNVIVNNGNMRIGIQIRGMTAGAGGGTDNSRIFANTIHDTNGFSDGIVFSVNDDSDNNSIFNNLIIGNVDTLVGNFGDNEGSGNRLFNNIITGNMESLFEGSGVQGMFSVSSPNTENAGTSFINLQGSVPDEYYSLTASQDSTGNDPATDYLGNSRSDPPDVGAFEFQDTGAGCDIIVPDDYGTIQGAVNAASSGQVVCIRTGTYAEMIDINGNGVELRSFGTDAVTITGGSNSRVLRFFGNGNTIRGISLHASSSPQFVLAYASGADNNVVDQCDIVGGLGTEKWVYSSQASGTVFTDNTFSGYATYDGPFFFSNSDDFIFRGNDVDCSGLASGSGTAFFTEWMNEEDGSNYNYIENNRFYNLGSEISVSAFMFRESDGMFFRNNVIEIDYDYPTGNAIFQIRGMTDGGDSCDTFYLDSNTIDLGSSSLDQIILESDTPTNNKITNNLVIGSFGTFVEPLSPLNSGTGNLIENNYATVSSVAWSSGLGPDWSVGTNYPGQSVSWVNSGLKPSPFYELTSSLDGGSYSWNPSVDYNEDSRLSPPDAGAFEYSGASVCGNSQCDSGECSSCLSDCTAQDCLNDGTCQESFGETCETTTDCACSGSELCCSGNCQVPSCSQDSDCGSDSCIVYTCSNPGTCSATCSSVQITQCTDSDGCCPSGCTDLSDNDCTAQAGLCQNITSLYHLDSDAQDSSGNGNDGTVTGATVTTSQSGFGQAYSFSSGQEISLPQITLPSQFTYSAWIYPLSSSTWITILTDQSSTRWLGMGDMILEWYDSSDNYFGSALTPNTWYHVAVTYDGTSLKAFLDGSPVGFPLSRSYGSTTDTFIIGNNQWDEYFQGTIDEVVIWSRSLSPQEILDLATATGPITCSGTSIHRADTAEPFGCVDTNEILWFVKQWNYDSTGYPMHEMMEGIALWSAGTGCS